MNRYMTLCVMMMLIGDALCAQPLLSSGADQQVYVVTVRPDAAIDGTRVIAGQMAASYGGTVVEGAGGGDDSFVIRVPESRVRVLAADPRVKSLVPMKQVPIQHVPVPQAVVETVGWTGGVSYSYDGAGNIFQIGNDSFAYDGASRLVKATVNSVTRRYDYDAFGNRTACTQFGPNDCQGFSINAAENRNRIKEAGYDPSGNGNLTSLSGHVYSYDSMNMMTRDTFGLLAREFVYTADDERIATYNAGSSWNWTIRAVDGKVLREFTSSDGPAGPGTASWQWAKDYVWRDGLLLASRQPNGTSATTYHYHLDHLGTPRRITDQNDRIAGVHDYFAFGPELGGTMEPSATMLKYTGHERDEWPSGGESTLDYMHARYYSPWLGRFLSVDPVLGDPSRPQSWNRYAYVANNPVSRTDPTGKCDITDCWMLFQSLQQVSGLVMEGFVDTAAHSGMGNIILGAQTGDRQRMVYGQAQLDHEVITMGMLSYMDGLGSSSTTETPVTEQLSAKAEEVHGVLDPIARSNRTTAVLRTSAGDIVAGGARDLTPAQRTVVARGGDIAAKLPGAHAEITAATKAAQIRATPQALVSTRAFCPNCTQYLQELGAKIIDAYTAIWP